MNENITLLIFGIFLIMAFLGVAAIICYALDYFCPNIMEKINEWLDIPSDEWDE